MLNNQEHSSLLSSNENNTQVKLDILSAGSSVIIIKSGTRICGCGAARTNVPILLKKIYYEVKIQKNGQWIIGLCSSNTPLNSIQSVINNSSSWVLTNKAELWSKGSFIGHLKKSINESDIIGVMYDHMDLKFTVNGLLIECEFIDKKQFFIDLNAIQEDIYPVFGVENKTVLDVNFKANNFQFTPPFVGFSEMIVKNYII